MQLNFVEDTRHSTVLRRFLFADLTELSLPSNININFPEGKDKPMHFEITIKPDEGYYRNGKFLFDFQISTGYPYDAPKVKCKTKVTSA